MRFGIVLPIFLTSAEREAMAERSHASLLRTVIPPRFTPLPLYVVAAGRHSFDVAVKNFSGTLEMGLLPNILPQPDEVHGPDSAVLWAVEKLFAETNSTHVIILTDDLVYNPQWFLELTALILRHPDARAWNVYRSAHTRHHRTLSQGVSNDHLVTSMSGNGTCWTREEHAAWGVKWQDGPHYPNPQEGTTTDLHHAYFRPGERWATDKSYIQHIGTRGVHAYEGCPEYALNFAGEGEA